MSVVAIPFKEEDTSTVLANLMVAAQHDRIDEVWAVGDHEQIASAIPGIIRATGTGVTMVPDSRIGTRRPGKGDAMNTALMLANEKSVDRLHFYDADITNFGPDWIDGAENAADRGFDVVRHTFPRSPTDAMITWFITKPILAMKFPATVLPAIGQPLGGELLLTRDAIAAFADDADIMARSDWGIDTMYTFAAVRSGFALFEHHIADGKRHALYGALSDLKTMLVECFDAVISLPLGEMPEINHQRDPDSPVPLDLQTESGYDIAATKPYVTTKWADGEQDLLELFSEPLAGQIDLLQNLGDFSFLTEDVWEKVLLTGQREFELGDAAWEALLFRLWVGRVLNYTVTHASSGYNHAMDYLASTVEVYQRNAVTSLSR